jgi:hypothetical protein
MKDTEPYQDFVERYPNTLYEEEEIQPFGEVLRYTICARLSELAPVHEPIGAFDPWWFKYQIVQDFQEVIHQINKDNSRHYMLEGSIEDPNKDELIIVVSRQ